MIQTIITYLLYQRIPNIKAYTITFDQDSKDLQKAKSLRQDSIGVELVEVFVPRDEKIIKQRFMDSIRVIEYPSTVQMEVGILQSFIRRDGKRWNQSCV